MRRIKSGERTAILLRTPEDAKVCFHEGDLNSKIELPEEIKKIMRSRGTKFDENSDNIISVHCEKEIIEFLSHDYPELKDDVLFLNSMEGEGRELWNEANMLILKDYIHAYIVLSQQERIENKNWDACWILTKRFVKAVTGNNEMKRSLINLFRHRFQGRALNLEEQERIDANKLALESKKNKKKMDFKMSTRTPSKMKRFGAI